MKTLRIHILVLALALTVLAAASGAHAYGYTQPKKITISAFAAVDSQSGKNGFGLALSTQESGLQDLSYVDFGSFRVLQATTLSPKTLVGLPVNLGVTVGYSMVDSGETAPKGMLTGLQVTLARTTTKGGLSLDLRASSLAKDFNPVKWFSDPDVLWAGAGVSYAF